MQPPLRLGFEVDRRPYAFVNDKGRFDGLVREYVDVVSRQLGVRIIPVPVRDWPEMRDKVRLGELDMVATAMPRTFDHLMLYSAPYESFPEVIVSRLDGPPIVSAGDLAGRRVALRDERHLVARARAVLPDSTLVPMASNESGLRELAEDRVDAYVGTLPPIDVLIRGRYAGVLHVVGPVGFQHELAIGVSPAHADLLAPMNRALASVNDAQRRAIRERWLAPEYDYGVAWHWLWLSLLIGSVIVGVLGFAFVRTRREARHRARAEDELATQLRIQRSLLESIPYPLFIKDRHGRYLGTNPAYEAAFGVCQQDLLGRTLLESAHITGGDPASLQEKERQVLETGERAMYEARAVMPDGQQGHHLVWINRVDLGHQKPGILGAIVDVTEIRQAEARARASEQRLNDITAALPVAVFQIRVEADGRRRFIYAGGDTLGTTGLSAEQVMEDEAGVFAQVHPDDRPRVVERVEAALASLQPVSKFDMRLHTIHGLRWIRSAGGVPRRLDDGAVEWGGYWIDVTEEHERTAVLARAKAEAEAGTEAKSAFLAMMSHEIRTPMAGVIGLMELIADTPLDAEQGNMLEMMQNSAGALLQILDDILDYSRIEAGQMALESVAFDPRELIDSVVGLFAARAWDKGLTLHNLVDWRIAPRLLGDSNRIRQILINLLSNAIKFTAHGHVAISVELLDHMDWGQSLRFSVQDTGEGIAAEHLDHLFEPFMQAETSTSRRFGGTGLGLPICRRLAALMGGRVELRSRYGEGTTVIFEVALAGVAGAEAAAAGDHFDGHQALLCVRDARLGQALSNALSAMGFAVVESDAEGLATFPGDPGRVLVYEAEAAGAEQVQAFPRRIRMVDRPELRSFRREAGEVVLYSNPLLWKSLRGACGLAYGLDGAGRVRPPVAAAGALAGAAARVLIVEDNAINRSVLSRQLQRLGIAHDEAANGGQALQALDSRDYDAVITDCRMPHVDGFELARRIRAAEAAGDRHLPIIALTASATPESVQRCLAAGMDEIIAKPVQMDDLRQCLLRSIPGLEPQRGGRGGDEAPPAATAAGASASASAQHDDHLHLLREAYGDPEPLRALLDALIEQVRQGIDAIRGLEGAGDARAVRDARHAIAGSMGLVPIRAVVEDAPLEEFETWLDEVRVLRSRLQGP